MRLSRIALAPTVEDAVAFLSVPQNLIEMDKFLILWEKPLPEPALGLAFEQVLGFFQSGQLGAGMPETPLQDYPEGGLMSAFLLREETDEFLPVVCEALVRLLMDEDQPAGRAEELATQVLRCRKVTVSHLGTMHRRLMKDTYSDGTTFSLSGAKFESLIGWRVPQAPLRFRIPNIRLRSRTDRYQTHPELVFRGIDFQEQFEEAFPQYAGFPIRMQVGIALQLGDEFPLPEEWHVDAF